MSPKNIKYRLKKALSGIALGAAALIASTNVGCEEQLEIGQAVFSEASIKSVAGGGDFNPLTAKKAKKAAKRE
jgi:hypothetical protein